MMKCNMTNKILEAMGPQGDTLCAVFKRMDIAETAIINAKDKYPLQSDLIHKAFQILCPSSLMQSAPTRLYTLHCTELCERVALEQDTRPGTDAEILAAFMELSFKAPPSRSWGGAYISLGKKHFDLPANMDESFSEDQPGEYDEIIGGLRKQLTDKERKIG